MIVTFISGELVMIITPDNATESFNVKADGELVTRTTGEIKDEW